MTLAAVRHNNPGDVSLPIKGWHGGGKIVGVTGQPGYADFATMAIGFEAMKQRLRDYILDKHRNTIKLIGQIYATDPHWGVAVASYSGIGLTEPLVAADGDQMAKLAQGIIRQETGHTYVELVQMQKEYRA